MSFFEGLAGFGVHGNFKHGGVLFGAAFPVLQPICCFSEFSTNETFQRFGLVLLK